jgi:hypothetical protein
VRASPVLVLVLLAAGCGAGESPHEVLARGLAAWRRSDAFGTAAAAERLAASGGAAWYGHRDFLQGLAEDLRSRAAEAELYGPFPRRDAILRALGHAEAAVAHLRMAARSREDWPEARYNVERTQRRLAALRAKREELRDEAGAPPEAPAGGQEGRAPDPQPGQPTAQAERPAASPEVEIGTTPPADALVERLFRRLAARELEKRALRQRERHRPGAPEVRDW